MHDAAVGEAWWTGRPPHDCPGLGDDGRLRSLAVVPTRGVTRARLLAYFDNGWTLTDVLFSALRSADALTRLPGEGLRYPLIFYWAHPAAFYVNILRRAGLLAAHIDVDLEARFATGVDEMPGEVVARPRSYWPEPAAVHGFRCAVYRAVRRLISEHPLLDGGVIGPDSPAWGLLMAMEHERIHLDTSSALIRELPLECVTPPPWFPPPYPHGGEPPPERMRACAGGTVLLGRRDGLASFGWDNELGYRRVAVPPFAVSATLVSNRALAAWVDAGGYDDGRWWSELGWAWRTRARAERPAFWRGDAGGAQRLRTLFAERPMPWNWPAEVNAHEARAYAAWRAARDGVDYRLLTEAEHRWLAGGTADEAADGNALHADGSADANLAWGSPRPVDAGTAAAAGVHELRGNVWEWVEDDFNPLGGFATHPLYPDFSTPCFDGRHTMILGGGFAATGAETSAFARFHFRPHFYRHAGFRLARSTSAAAAPAQRLDGPYERRAACDQYLLAHYGDAAERAPAAVRGLVAEPFPIAVAALAARHARAHRRALDLGCAVGRGTFELARHFDAALGIDASWTLIATATALLQGDAVPYEIAVTAGQTLARVARRPPDVDPARVAFQLGDALDLPDTIGSFDAVVAANLFDRVADPDGALQRAAACVRPGGALVVACPYTWHEAFTPRAAQRLDYGLLAGAFTMVQESDLPFVLREHARKYELVVSHVTVWRRR